MESLSIRIKKVLSLHPIKINNNACFKSDSIKRLLVRIQHVRRDLRTGILTKHALGESFMSFIIGNFHLREVERKEEDNLISFHFLKSRNK